MAVLLNKWATSPSQKNENLKTIRVYKVTGQRRHSVERSMSLKVNPYFGFLAS